MKSSLLFSLRLGALTCAVTERGGSDLPWTRVTSFTDPYSTALRQSDLVRWGGGPNSLFAPISGGAGGNISVQLDSTTGVARSFRFQLDNNRQGIKQRAELQNCFITNASLRAAGLDPASTQAQYERELRTLYWNCAAVPTEVVTQPAGWSKAAESSVSYDLLIPDGGLHPKAETIIGQFHGREDPRIFLAPNGSVGTGVHRTRTYASNSVVHFSSAETAFLCANTSRKYGNCVNGELLGADGAGTGWLYQSGGFPLLVFGYDPKSQWFYVEGRSDDREFKMTHTVADCHYHVSDYIYMRSSAGLWPLNHQSQLAAI